MYHGANKIAQFIPNDSSRQSSAMHLCTRMLRQSKVKVVIDLGCGGGNSCEFFKKIDPDIKWVGVDIADSPEVRERTGSGMEFVTYDGINLPFPDNYCDLILCKQVLEHVQNPQELLKSVTRVLKPEGVFIGSTSQLELFHSLSCFNYTPYGLKLLFEGAHLDVIELRPGIDFFTLFFSRLFSRALLIGRLFSRYFEKESPFNRIVGFFLRIRGDTQREINLWKLLFCGHLIFLAKKK
jgi:SAM-dependent methyltransferase